MRATGPERAAAPERRPRRAPGRAGIQGASALAPWGALPLGLLLGLGLWSYLAARWSRPDGYDPLPAPSEVLRSALVNADVLLASTLPTLQAVLLGFALGFGAAALLGFAISRSRLLDRALMPYLVASQAVPVIAVAPLLISFFRGNDLGIKVTVAGLTVFFPMLINTVVGLRGIEPEHHELMRLLSASRWQRLRLLELPAALPVLLAGIRVGITLSVIGAVVGEFVYPQRGLGVLIQQSRSAFNDALAFAALLALVTLALALYAGATLLERWLLARR